MLLITKHSVTENVGFYRSSSSYTILLWCSVLATAGKGRNVSTITPCKTIILSSTGYRVGAILTYLYNI